MPLKSFTTTLVSFVLLIIIGFSLAIYIASIYQAEGVHFDGGVFDRQRDAGEARSAPAGPRAVSPEGRAGE